MKNRTAFFSGLALFLCFCLLTGAGRVIHALESIDMLLGMLIAEIAAFLVPLLVVWIGAGRAAPIRLRLSPKISAAAVLGATVFAGIAMSTGVFLINYFLFRTNTYHPAALTQFAFQSPSDGPAGLSFVVLIIIPAVFEELFLRGALFSAHEKFAGTGTCIFFSGLCFAMLHGSLSNFVGPLLAGFLYAYLTYAFDSIWPAIVAHLINNVFYLGMMWLSNTYSAFGIWKYLPGVLAVLLLLCGYLSFCCFENLLVNDKIPKFLSAAKIGADVRAITLNLGFAVFLIAFIAKAVLGLL